MQKLIQSLGFCLAQAGILAAQQPSDDPQRASLIGLRRFAAHARVQVPQQSKLPSVDERLLRTRLEMVMRQEGLEIQGPADLRDGAAAQVSLVYLVIPILDQAGGEAGFAASSCIQASQLVRIPRVIESRHFTYTMAPTWSSCGMVVGDPEFYRTTILRNAEEQIGRFLRAWRSANPAEKRSKEGTRTALGLVTPAASRASPLHTPTMEPLCGGGC